MLVLRSEISSGMCAKLRIVAASNNRDHPTRSLSSSPLASTINCSPGSQALSEVTHQDHSIGITPLLLVRATYIYFCSSRTSRSWWITQSTQHHRRGCNTRGDYWLTSDLPAGVQWGGNGVPTPFCTVVTLLEDLDFSFQFLRVAPGAA